jgi:hypothetical protein
LDAGFRAEEVGVDVVGVRHELRTKPWLARDGGVGGGHTEGAVHRVVVEALDAEGGQLPRLGWTGDVVVDGQTGFRLVGLDRSEPPRATKLKWVAPRVGWSRRGNAAGRVGDVQQDSTQVLIGQCCSAQVVESGPGVYYRQ